MIGRHADQSGRRPLLLLGWGLIPVQGLLYAALPGPFALVFGNMLNAVSGAIFGVTMTVVAADLTRRAGCFNLTLGALGVAISVGASLSTFSTGISAAAFGARMAVLGLALVGLCSLLLLCCGPKCRRRGRSRSRRMDPAPQERERQTARTGELSFALRSELWCVPQVRRHSDVERLG